MTKRPTFPASRSLRFEDRTPTGDNARNISRDRRPPEVIARAYGLNKATVARVKDADRRR